MSFCADWVKGKGAGKKGNRGWPPKPDTSSMNAAEAKRLSVDGRKNGKRRATCKGAKVVMVEEWMAVVSLMIVLATQVVL